MAKPLTKQNVCHNILKKMVRYRNLHIFERHGVYIHKISLWMNQLNEFI